MRHLGERLLSLVLIISPGPQEDIFSEIGWGVATLLILGSSLALASLAWFFVGLFTN